MSDTVRDAFFGGVGLRLPPEAPDYRVENEVEPEAELLVRRRHAGVHEVRQERRHLDREWNGIGIKSRERGGRLAAALGRGRCRRQRKTERVVEGGKTRPHRCLTVQAGISEGADNVEDCHQRRRSRPVADREDGSSVQMLRQHPPQLEGDAPYSLTMHGHIVSGFRRHLALFRTPTRPLLRR